MRPIRNVLAAPASFKETLTAAEAAEAMAAGVRRADPSVAVVCCPIADGGEGSLDALASALGAEIRRVSVTGPLGDPIEARYGVARRRVGGGGGGGRVGIVELAEASGLGLVAPSRRDPTVTTTFGTGELIAALTAECDEILVCVGGSATVDGGAGLAQALGANFCDRRGSPIRAPLTGGRLGEITAVEPVRGLPVLRVLCDVRNRLLGADGAAAVYGPQKGATPAQVRELEGALAHLAALGGRPELAALPGAGAAGGAAFGLAAFCGARLERGIDAVLDAVGFHERCARADLVLTGEGSLDAQTLQGKACAGVLDAATRHGRQVIAIVGRAGPGAERLGFARVESLSERYGLERAMREPAPLIAEVTARLIRPP